jgi:hypothetical protein
MRTRTGRRSYHVPPSGQAITREGVFAGVSLGSVVNDTARDATSGR